MLCVRLGTVCSEIQESVAVVSKVAQDTLPPCRCHGSPDSFAPSH